MLPSKVRVFDVDAEVPLDLHLELLFTGVILPGSVLTTTSLGFMFVERALVDRLRYVVAG